MREEYNNITVCGVWETGRGGHFNTAPFDDKALGLIKEALETGGKFLIRKRSQESMAKAKDPKKTPPYFLEWVSAEEVAKFEAKRDHHAAERGL